jgi:hypothetical protein
MELLTSIETTLSGGSGIKSGVGGPAVGGSLPAVLVGLAMFLIMLLGISDDNQYGTVYNGITMVISNTD